METSVGVCALRNSDQVFSKTGVAIFEVSMASLVSTHWRITYCLFRLYGVWSSVHDKTIDKIKMKNEQNREAVESLLRKIFDQTPIKDKLDKLFTDLTIQGLDRDMEVLIGSDSDKDAMTQNTSDDTRNKFECLLFGWIRLEIEDKSKMRVPLSLKKLCVEFYGNIMMRSDILNLNQTNIIGYMLKQKLNDIRKYFIPKLVCNEYKHGFDKKEIEIKLNNDWNNTFVAIKTNNNHIYVQFYLYHDQSLFGCCLQNTFDAKPIVYEQKVQHGLFLWKAWEDHKYLFPNGFMLRGKLNLSDIFISDNAATFNDTGDLNKDDFINDINIDRYEVFRL